MIWSGCSRMCKLLRKFASQWRSSSWAYWANALILFPEAFQSCSSHRFDTGGCWRCCASRCSWTFGGSLGHAPGKGSRGIWSKQTRLSLSLGWKASRLRAIDRPIAFDTVCNSCSLSWLMADSLNFEMFGRLRRIGGWLIRYSFLNLKYN